jgi:uncharacterized damage-inducible protein DinB
MHPKTELLLTALDQAFDHKAWHGTTLRGSVRGLSAEEAAWRPAPGRHNIWEIVLHTAYWKYIVRRRVSGVRDASFARKGSNWFPSPASASEREWKSDVALLQDEHRKLREAVAAFPPQDLGKLSPKKKWTREEEIFGIAAHDLYHAGQIQLLKRLREK